jgi:anti-sigma B factor antagonist
MEISKVAAGNTLVLEIVGRLDAAWADHLDASLAETVREGHHHLRLDLAGVNFLSSAGIAVLMKFYKQLSRIEGSLRVVRPSTQVRTVLEITRLVPILVEIVAEPIVQAPDDVGRQVTVGAGRLEVFDLAPGATLAWRAIGSSDMLPRACYAEQHAVTMACPESTFVLGVGAFGGSFADCRARFGEFLAVCGAAAYQPADASDAPDYLVSSGSLALEPKLLYGLSCEGRPAHLIRFERSKQDGPIALGDLASGCLDVTKSSSAGIVVVAETSGLIGAALRRSPVADQAVTGDLFAHPGVREWLSFTAEPAFPRSTVLLVGVAHRGAPVPAVQSQLRPIGASADLSGHFHAAAFGFRPLQKGRIDLKEIVSDLFKQEELLGVLHLLRDDRGSQSRRESGFIRGACWVGPIAPEA